MADNQRNNAAPDVAAPAPAPAPDADADAAPSHSKDSRLCWIISLAGLLICAITIGICAKIIWFTNHSNAGGPEFRVESIKVSSFSRSGPGITGNWDIGIRVDNKGKSELQYDNIMVGVYYQLQLVSKPAVGPFNVAPHDYIMLMARNGTLVTTPNINGTPEEPLDFYVELEVTEGTIKGRKYGEIGLSTTLACGDIMLDYSSDTNIATMSGGPYQCNIQV